MNRIPGISRAGRIRRVSALLTVLALSCLGLTATGAAAFARIMPPQGSGAGATPDAVPAVTRVVVAGGMPGWQIALIAVGAAVAAAALALLADRAWAAHRTIARPAGCRPAGRAAGVSQRRWRRRSRPSARCPRQR